MLRRGLIIDKGCAQGLRKGYETFPSKGKISYPFFIFNTTESSLMLLLHDFFEFLTNLIVNPIGPSREVAY